MFVPVSFHDRRPPYRVTQDGKALSSETQLLGPIVVLPTDSDVSVFYFEFQVERLEGHSFQNILVSMIPFSQDVKSASFPLHRSFEMQVDKYGRTGTPVQPGDIVGVCADIEGQLEEGGCTALYRSLNGVWCDKHVFPGGEKMKVIMGLERTRITLLDAPRYELPKDLHVLTSLRDQSIPLDQ